MNKRVMEFCKEIKGQTVNVLQGETPKPIIIYYRGEGQQAPAKAPIHPIPKIVIKVPAPFRYSSDKAVPWNYTNQVISQEPRAVRVNPKTKQEPSINDIVGTGGLTRSGQCYASSPSRVKKREEGIEQSDVEATVLKKKGKNWWTSQSLRQRQMNFSNSLNTTNTASSSYISCLLRSLYWHWCCILSLTEKPCWRS